MEEYTCEILIIGSGPAGLNAGIYCGRAGRDTIILDGKEPSALEQTKEISNWLGEKQISGPELVKKFKDHAESYENVRILKGDVISLMMGMGKNMISTRSANITAEVVIIATGRGQRKEVIKNEAFLVGYGISYCALCDGPLYKERVVYLYGNDEEMIEDALILQQMGCIVKIISTVSMEQLPDKIKEAKEAGIEIIDNTKILEAIPNSQGVVEKIIVDSRGSDAPQELNLDCLFIFSHVPSNSIFKKAGIVIDENGNVKVNKEQETNIKSVYAAGDVTGGLFQVIFAAAEGARAGINAAKYVRHAQKD